MSEEKKKTLEEAFSELEEILGRLNNKETSLDDSFAAYTEGIGLVKYCNEQLDKVEKRMLILNQEGGVDEF